MIWKKILNQNRVVEALQAAIESDRIAHAYLFHGPDGTGKKAVALAFAQALLCKQGRSVPCGTCNGCSKASRLIHPDLHLILPYPGDPKTEEITERFALIAEDPYGPVDFVHAPNGIGEVKQSTNKQVTVKRDRINAELIRPAGFKAVEGGYKVAILTDVDLINASGSNAVLKLLEEPPPLTVFLLTTTRPDRLLPTIISRCQQIRFDRLSVDKISEGLLERFEVSSQQVEAIARMADGSMVRAIELAQNQELLGLRLLVVDFFRDSWAANVRGIYKLTQVLGSSGREQVKSGLAVMLSWLRDLVLYRATGDSSRMVNTDQADTIHKFSENLPDANLSAMIEAVEDAIRLVERNVNTTLVLVSLSDLMHAAMHGSPTSPLYQSLADISVA